MLMPVPKISGYVSEDIVGISSSILYSGVESLFSQIISSESLFKKASKLLCNFYVNK